MSTTIQVSDAVKATLDRMKIFERETYSEVIEFLIEDTLEINEKTKKELEERSKSKDFVSHEEVEKELGL